MNHTDGNVFYKETGRLEIKRQFYRIPCVYDWNNGSKLLDWVVLEALSAVISKPCRKQVKGGAGAGWKFFISKNKLKKHGSPMGCKSSITLRYCSYGHWRECRNDTPLHDACKQHGKRA